ncbi:MAG: hypothetical protein P8168_13985 [Deltaproteobacteria bacterium]
MQFTKRLAGTALVASLLLILGTGCSSSSQVQQPPTTSYMRSQTGTSNELSPLAPPGASQVRKVGNHWTCRLHGHTLVYNSATSQWEPQK